MTSRYTYEGEVRVRFTVAYHEKLTQDQVKETVIEALPGTIGIYMFGEKEKPVEVDLSADDDDVSVDEFYDEEDT